MVAAEPNPPASTNNFADIDRIKKVNSFTHEFPQTYDILLSNLPYGKNDCEKTAEQKDNDKIENSIHEILPSLCLEIEFVLHANARINSRRNLVDIQKIKHSNRLEK